MFNIYCITNKVNGKKYVGLTKKSLEERWESHISTTRKKKRYAIHNAMLKYGIDNFSIELLESNVEKERETFWIESLNTHKEGYNLTLGGDGTRGVVFNETARKLLSENAKNDHTNRKIGMYGKKHSPTTRKKMSESAKNVDKSHLRGRKYSEESLEKMRKPKSISMRNKLSETLKARHREDQTIFTGINNPMFGRKHSPDTIQALTKLNKERSAIKTECEYCGKHVDALNFKKWHGNRCKVKNYEDIQTIPDGELSFGSSSGDQASIR